MTSRFGTIFAVAMVATLASLGAVGWMIVALTTEPPRARHLASMYEFELPHGWRCVSEGTEQLCRFGEPPNPAIVIVTAKYRGVHDTLEVYEAHLQKPLSNQTLSGKPTASRMIHVLRRRINGREWVEGLHFESEVPNFYTYYLAGVTSHVGVLVTFSVHKAHRERLKGEFDIMMQTLRIHQRIATLRGQRSA